MHQPMTDVVFILDKSGSMYGLSSDTIGGFNAMLKKQRALEGPCRVTTVLFNHDYHVLHDRRPIETVKPLTHRDYTTDGTTALLDAIGRTIKHFDELAHAPKARLENVLFVIITDGMENDSRYYGAAQIRSMIRARRKEQKWEFLFLGANIDAVETAESYGIEKEKATDYVPDADGTALNFIVMCDSIEDFRVQGALDAKHLDRIREDHAKRGRKTPRS